MITPRIRNPVYNPSALKGEQGSPLTSASRCTPDTLPTRTPLRAKQRCTVLPRTRRRRGSVVVTIWFQWDPMHTRTFARLTTLPPRKPSNRPGRPARKDRRPCGLPFERGRRRYAPRGRRAERGRRAGVERRSPRRGGHPALHPGRRRHLLSPLLLPRHHRTAPPRAGTYSSTPSPASHASSHTVPPVRSDGTHVHQAHSVLIFRHTS